MQMTISSRALGILGATAAASFSLVLVLAGPAAAQTKESSEPAPTSGFLAEFQALEGRVGDRIVELAKTIPAERYSWRPADGTRSVSEVLTHLAAANFGTAAAVGAPLPADLPQDLSKVTDKRQVITWLETSYQLTRGIASGMAGVDLSQPLPGAGGMSMSGSMMSFIEHQGEHLGQLIAYARSVGVVPPWSR